MIGASKKLYYSQSEDINEEIEEDGELEYPYPFDIYPYFRDVYEVSGTSHDYGMLCGKQIDCYALDCINEISIKYSVDEDIQKLLDLYLLSLDNFISSFNQNHHVMVEYLTEYH
jgi:hypothetical protein